MTAIRKNIHKSSIFRTFVTLFDLANAERYVLYNSRRCGLGVLGPASISSKRLHLDFKRQQQMRSILAIECNEDQLNWENDYESME